MNPRFWRWTIGLSWGFLGLVAAITAGRIALGFTTPPSWWAPFAALTFVVALPLAPWSPVFLVFSYARSQEALRRVALVGFALTCLSLGLTFFLLTDGTGLWRLLRRASLPVMLVTLAVAWFAMAEMTPAGPRVRRILSSGIAAMCGLALIVTGMVIADSGNRTLFALLGVLLAWGLVQLPIMLVARRRAHKTSS